MNISTRKKNENTKEKRKKKYLNGQNLDQIWQVERKQEKKEEIKKVSINKTKEGERK